MDNIESISVITIYDGRIVCYVHRFGECKVYLNVTNSSFTRLVRMQIKLMLKGQENE